MDRPRTFHDRGDERPPGDPRYVQVAEVCPAASGAGCWGAAPDLVAVLAILQLWRLGWPAWEDRLPRAAAEGRLEEVRKLLRSGVGADTHTQENTFTALHSAAGRGHHKVVMELLRAGADVSRRNGFGANALLGAMTGLRATIVVPERDRIVRVLLERASDANCQATTSGVTPLTGNRSRGYHFRGKVCFNGCVNEE